ncbi:hypothetical protein TanjilG_15556, partial [Lupinus angustifolius]
PKSNDLGGKSFFFGPNELAAIHGLLPTNFGRCTTFEVLTAYIWRCYTKALQLESHKVVRMMRIVKARSKFNPPLPAGYYGNCFAYPTTVIEVSKLSKNPFE